MTEISDDKALPYESRSASNSNVLMKTTSGAALAGTISVAMAPGREKENGGLGAKPPENFLTTLFFAPRKRPFSA